MPRRGVPVGGTDPKSVKNREIQKERRESVRLKLQKKLNDKKAKALKKQAR